MNAWGGEHCPTTQIKGNCPDINRYPTLKEANESEFLCSPGDSYENCGKKTANAGKCYGDRINRFLAGLSAKCWKTLDESHAWPIVQLNDIINSNIERLANENGESTSSLDRSSRSGVSPFPGWQPGLAYQRTVSTAPATAPATAPRLPWP